MAKDKRNDVMVIKKYANRRLYNTATSCYVTQDDLAQMVREGEDFRVVDAKTGEDITRSVLTQIIVDQENRGGQTMLPISVLRQLIGLYGDSMQHLVPSYLESSMQVFAQNQDKMREMMQKSLGQPFGSSLGNMFSMAPMEELQKQNMAMFDQAMQQTMKMLNPFGAGAGTGTTAAPPRTEDKPSTAKTPEKSAEISADEALRRFESLHAEMQALQNALKKLGEK